MMLMRSYSVIKMHIIPFRILLVLSYTTKRLQIKSFICQNHLFASSLVQKTSNLTYSQYLFATRSCNKSQYYFIQCPNQINKVKPKHSDTS